MAKLHMLKVDDGNDYMALDIHRLGFQSVHPFLDAKFSQQEKKDVAIMKRFMKKHPDVDMQYEVFTFSSVQDAYIASHYSGLFAELSGADEECAKHHYVEEWIEELASNKRKRLQ